MQYVQRTVWSRFNTYRFHSWWCNRGKSSDEAWVGTRSILSAPSKINNNIVRKNPVICKDCITEILRKIHTLPIKTNKPDINFVVKLKCIFKEVTEGQIFYWGCNKSSPLICLNFFPLHFLNILHRLLYPLPLSSYKPTPRNISEFVEQQEQYH